MFCAALGNETVPAHVPRRNNVETGRSANHIHMQQHGGTTRATSGRT